MWMLCGKGVKTRLKEHLLEECNLHTIVRLPNSVFRPYASIGTNLLFFEKGQPTQEVWFYEHRVPEGQKAYSMTRPIRVDHLKGCADWWGGADRKDRQETELAWKVTIDEIKARNYNLDFRNPHTVADDFSDPVDTLQRKTDIPILNASQFVKIPAAGRLAGGVAPFERVPEDLSERRRIRPERRLYAGW